MCVLVVESMDANAAAGQEVDEEERKKIAKRTL